MPQILWKNHRSEENYDQLVILTNYHLKGNLCFLGMVIKRVQLLECLGIIMDNNVCLPDLVVKKVQ